MAFSNAERVAIRSYLGWPQMFFDDDQRLESAINVLEQDSDVEAEARLILTDLATIRTAITNPTAAQLRLQAYKVGSVELPGPGEIAELRSIGRQLSGWLAAMLNVMVKHDVWSPAGPTEGGRFFGATNSADEIPFG